MNTNIFLSNVVVASWQIYAPILLVIAMSVGYIFSKFIRQHLLFIYVLFLTVFIPLFPKIPLIGIRNTFVYIRLDDIMVSIGVALWLFYVIRRKVSWKSPLTIPIFVYWIVGLVSTLIAVIFIFPSLANVFPHDAFLFFARHIEYLIVFFLAFAAMREKKYVPWMIGTLVLTVLLVIGYGFGQAKYPQDFLAYSTMSEEYAKGEPLILKSGARIQATFAGHYDLAAYLVMLIPLIASLIFGVKNWFARIGFLVTSFLALILLLMTASRTSFAVYLLAIVFMLFLQKQKKWIIPVVIVSILLLQSFHTLSERFSSTLTQVPVVIDARTGRTVGLAQQDANGKVSVIDKTPVGQNVAPGTAYIVSNNAEAQSTTTQVIYKRTRLFAGTESAQITDLNGDFVVKKALAYDSSFTTRFQGEWPRAMAAFLRDPILGSGYSSISLATDNNYLRILGETGSLGFISFLFIFLITAIYAYRVLPDVSSSAAKSLVLGTMAGTFGLALNATLIDVFEASKVAYTLWGLLGISIGTLALYQKHTVHYRKELRILLSVPAICLYLLIASFSFFTIMLPTFFVADDFTWLRWVVDCNKILGTTGIHYCSSYTSTVINFFTHADNFFYRPASKTYFYLLYSFSGFNPVAYHVVSLLLHWACTFLVFLLSLRILKNKFMAFLVAILFLLLSAHAETLFWISSTQHIFVAFFTLLAVYLFDTYKQKKQWYLLVLSGLCCLFAPLFHEAGVIAGPLVLAYSLLFYWKDSKKSLGNGVKNILLLLPLPVYFVLRNYAKSIWGTADYSYRLSKLPFNVVGNLVGYFLIAIFGVSFIPTYESLRSYGKTHEEVIVLVIILWIVVVSIGIFLVKKKITAEDKRITLVSLLFFIIPLTPYIGLGNIASRYLYLASFGVCLFLVYFANRLFSLLPTKNKNIVPSLLIVGTIFFGWYHYSQISEVNNDWVRAGDISKTLLGQLAYTYSQPGALPVNPVFYFSNVPATTGQAFVFPNGLQDAIWMTFQDKNITVVQTPNISTSFQQSEGSASARFYDFDEKGNATAIERTEIIVPKTQHAK